MCKIKGNITSDHCASGSNEFVSGYYLNWNSMYMTVNSIKVFDDNNVYSYKYGQTYKLTREDADDRF